MRGALLPLVALLGACGAEIGDDCGTNVDCSQDGDRICDKSLPGGYCTVEGCDEGTCPEEAICVRFFPVNGLVHTCLDAGDCTVDEVCLTDGFCAARLSERRFCMRACGQDYQCRDGYVCRFTGVAGVELAELAPEPDTGTPPGRFCGPPLSPR